MNIVTALALSALAGAARASFRRAAMVSGSHGSFQRAETDLETLKVAIGLAALSEPDIWGAVMLHAAVDSLDAAHAARRAGEANTPEKLALSMADFNEALASLAVPRLDGDPDQLALLALDAVVDAAVREPAAAVTYLALGVVLADSLTGSVGKFSKGRPHAVTARAWFDEAVGGQRRRFNWLAPAHAEIASCASALAVLADHVRHAIRERAVTQPRSRLARWAQRVASFLF